CRFTTPDSSVGSESRTSPSPLTIADSPHPILRSGPQSEEPRTDHRLLITDYRQQTGQFINHGTAVVYKAFGRPWEVGKIAALRRSFFNVEDHLAQVFHAQETERGFDLVCQTRQFLPVFSSGRCPHLGKNRGDGL